MKVEIEIIITTVAVIYFQANAGEEGVHLSTFLSVKSWRSERHIPCVIIKK